MIKKGPAEWRIFFFNIFSHAPQLKEDFTWPDNYVKGFLRSMPSMFAGGKGSITHMHFDIDLPSLFHTQFIGRKRVLLFPNEERYKLYRKPFEVLSLADFSNYYNADKSKVDVIKFPALKLTNGYDIILEHGDTLFMPSGYWHHMEYLESGFAMSLRAWNKTIGGKIHGGWNVVGKERQRVGEQAREQRRRRAEPYAAPAQAGEVLHLAPGRLDVGEDAPGEREQRLAGGRQRDVAPRAAEQRCSELGLQRPDLLGQGRLRHPENFAARVKCLTSATVTKYVSCCSCTLNSLRLSKRASSCLGRT